MIAEEALHGFHIDTYVSLGTILGILALSVLASLVFKRDEDSEPPTVAQIEGKPVK